MFTVCLSRFSSRAVLLPILLAMGVVVAVLTAHPIQAATCNFTGAVSTSFNTQLNWDCGYVPNSTTTAVIPTGTSTTMTAGATVLAVLINTNATLTTTGFNLAIEDSVTSTGALVAGSDNLITVGNDWDMSGAATFTSGNGTVLFSTSTADSSIEHRVTSAATLAFNNLTVSSTRNTRLYSGVLYTVADAFTITQGNVILNNGADLTTSGAFSIATSQGFFTLSDSTNILTANGTTTNNGILASGGSNGIYVFNGDVVNNATFGPLVTESVTFKKAFTNSGTFTTGTSTVAFSGTVAQTIPANLTFWNLTWVGFNKTLAGNATTTNALVSTGGSADLAGFTLAVMGDLTAVQVGSTGVLALRGASSTQSISGTTLFPTLLVDKSAGTASLLANASINVAINLRQGTFNGGTGTITIVGSSATPFLMGGGTFVHGGGTVTYIVNADISVASTTFNNLVLSPPSTARTYSLTASTTAAGTTNVNASTTLAVGTNVFTAVGTITNTGLITVTTASGGKIVHTRESVAFTDSSGVTQTSYTAAATVYVQVQDSNRNLSGTTTESFTIPVTMAAGAGSDSETLTLTETGVATGIFRSSGVSLVTSSAASTGNNQFEITATGIGTATYTDNQDAADTGTGTATMTYSTSGSSSSSGGGGGGVGSSGSPSIPAPTVQQQTYLNNLQNIGVPIHALLKLPDDSNPSTQEDTAVYYVGGDGMRHAFPNSKIYFTWYCDFAQVQVINGTQLATIPLGKNVGYRPGVKMVKFTTDPKVYAVTASSTLRWITSEAVATALYGAAWNKNIDDLSDANYNDYTFGASIVASADFNPIATTQSVQYPSDSMNIAGYVASKGTYPFSCPVPRTDEQKDSDGDGLNDAKEKQLGTDILKPDTDGDGLKDNEEVNVYRTNPLKPDTDGDGYTDYTEVTTNNNPLGTGVCPMYRCIL